MSADASLPKPEIDPVLNPRPHAWPIKIDHAGFLLCFNKVIAHFRQKLRLGTITELLVELSFVSAHLQVKSADLFGAREHTLSLRTSFVIRKRLIKGVM
jgi:hypothetical protein